MNYIVGECETDLSSSLFISIACRSCSFCHDAMFICFLSLYIVRRIFFTLYCCCCCCLSFPDAHTPDCLVVHRGQSLKRAWSRKRWEKKQLIGSLNIHPSQYMNVHTISWRKTKTQRLWNNLPWEKNDRNRVVAFNFYLIFFCLFFSIFSVCIAIRFGICQ